MNAGPLTSLIADFATNWATHQPDLAVLCQGSDVDLPEEHLLYAELHSLCSGNSASLPFFSSGSDVLWCTMAPDSDGLRSALSDLNTWVLPSFGGFKKGDGFQKPHSTNSYLAAKIIAASPGGYYRWRCPRAKLTHVLQRFRTQRTLAASRPPRTQAPRPSLFELRARFAAALLVGDRDGADSIVELLDSLQLETAVNTQFMRIRLWHHFGELDRIRNHPDLPLLLTQPLPPRIRAWIDEARGFPAPGLPSVHPGPNPTETTTSASFSPPPVLFTTEDEPSETQSPSLTWVEWFSYVKDGRRQAAEAFLQERPESAAPTLSVTSMEAIVAHLDELFVDDALRSRERGLLVHGLSELLQECIREPHFPRASLGSLYHSFMRIWGVLHAGTSTGQEEGHVLLELANAVLRLNIDAASVRQTLEHWWQAKRSLSQLPFVLDAIELLDRELPGTETIANLWIDAADTIKRVPNSLSLADRNLWRQAGERLGFDSVTIQEYLPLEPEAEDNEDLLTAASLQHVAIVCLREEQAKQAAEAIKQRSNAKITVVTSSTAGAETAQACQADVVLFVWMASTHAVFRAFDNYDRRCFCYVQGTGSSSIVRTLERWILQR